MNHIGVKFYCVMIFVLCLISQNSQAQQFSQYALFADNLNVYNPGYTGIKDQVEINGGARYQWIGLNGSPFSQSLNMHAPLYKLGSGIGLTLTNNQQGLQRNTAAGINYAQIWRKRKFNVGVGLRAGLLQSYLDGEKIITPGGSYEAGVINHNDPILPISGISKLAPDIALGLVLSGKTTFIGISALYVNQPNLKLTSTNSPSLKRQYILTFGKKIKLNSKLFVSNNYLIKSDISDTQAETNLLLSYKQILRFGVGYRSSQINSDALIALLSIKLSNKIAVSYAYEYPIGIINKVAFSSHELLINYKIDINSIAKPDKIIYNPRF